MLKDRRVLLEQELKKAHDQAAAMYLNIIVSGVDASSTEYQLLRDRIATWQFDLDMVNQLIGQGHE